MNDLFDNFGQPDLPQTRLDIDAAFGPEGARW
jgi:hypothetical protein